MILYFSIYFLAVTLYYFSLHHKKQTELYILLGSLLFLACFVGFSDMLGGYDRYIYSELFDDAADRVSYNQYLRFAAIFGIYPSEYGYGWYNIAVGFITSNRYIFVLITTFIIYFLLFKSIKDYCSNYPFAVILFLGLWFFFTFTYLRQVMGATIAWLGVKYIADRKLLKFLIVWVIAYRFHNSAIVFLPLYFIPIIKFKKGYVFAIMLVALFLGLTGLPTALFDAYDAFNPDRQNNVSVESGFRIAYFVEAFFFLVLIFLRYDKLPHDAKSTVLLNMALVFCASLLFFVKSENGGRLAWYYMIGVIATITRIATYRRRRQDYAFLMIVVCLFLYVRIVISWGVLLYPYQTFFTNEIRRGDYIEEKYEYDHNYDKDKMYRAAFWFNR